MRVEDTAQPLKPVTDFRPRMPEPPVVRLISIDDVSIHATPATSALLDAFYIELLAFERDDDPAHAIAYRAEKNRLIVEVFDVVPPRDDFRPVQLATPLFDAFVRRITELEMPFEWQKGVAPGLETAFLQDPAGNWISVEPIRAVG